MCSYIVEKAALTGSAKGRGWMKIDTAHVYYDHPFHAPLDHALTIDFVHAADGGRERVAIEISAESARDLVRAILAALENGEREHAAAQAATQAADQAAAQAACPADGG
ncbi:MAG: hypothetical protein IT536_19805 [Hyphomicrobiales bacterium]|nr:hypothetical protein [Hyphomicrobiales bacterium]